MSTTTVLGFVLTAVVVVVFLVVSWRQLVRIEDETDAGTDDG